MKIVDNPIQSINLDMKVIEVGFENKADFYTVPDKLLKRIEVYKVGDFITFDCDDKYVIESIYVDELGMSVEDDSVVRGQITQITQKRNAFKIDYSDDFFNCFPNDWRLKCLNIGDWVIVEGITRVPQLKARKKGLFWVNFKTIKRIDRNDV